MRGLLGLSQLTMALKFGLFVPPFGGAGRAGPASRTGRAAEGSGWDGFFLWDHILALPGMAVADPWVTMAAVAQSTRDDALGMLVTPLARRRPWVLARQAATLDRLSGGRLVVGVGLGDDSIGEFSSFRGEPTEPGATGRHAGRGTRAAAPLLVGTGRPVGGPVLCRRQRALFASARPGPVTRLGGLSVAPSPSAGPGGPAPGLFPAVRLEAAGTSPPSRTRGPSWPHGPNCARTGRPRTWTSFAGAPRLRSRRPSAPTGWVRSKLPA